MSALFSCDCPFCVEAKNFTDKQEFYLHLGSHNSTTRPSVSMMVDGHMLLLTRIPGTGGQYECPACAGMGYVRAIYYHFKDKHISLMQVLKRRADESFSTPNHGKRQRTDGSVSSSDTASSRPTSSHSSSGYASSSRSYSNHHSGSSLFASIITPTLSQASEIDRSLLVQRGSPAPRTQQSQANMMLVRSGAPSPFVDDAQALSSTAPRCSGILTPSHPQRQRLSSVNTSEDPNRSSDPQGPPSVDSGLAPSSRQRKNKASNKAFAAKMRDNAGNASKVSFHLNGAKVFSSTCADTILEFIASRMGALVGSCAMHTVLGLKANGHSVVHYCSLQVSRGVGFYRSRFTKLLNTDGDHICPRCWCPLRSVFSHESGWCKNNDRSEWEDWWRVVPYLVWVCTELRARVFEEVGIPLDHFTEPLDYARWLVLPCHWTNESRMDARLTNMGAIMYTWLKLHTSGNLKSASDGGVFVVDAEPSVTA
ncbi:hypothetical protein Moror_15439 [Moniliophthora roreri MCA 2997]|uniref:Uncharacterized protein n=1 Tax=Moniliophthora roreri (strain MCA 2997) TaxID=1381753 RepID=V2W1U6_MONRO|nr:hypothetical protein Moror_15439 [Moniliophthora roreri MCA 2997]